MREQRRIGLTLCVALCAALALGGLAPVLGATGLTPHGEAINQAIDNGLAWLADTQLPDGSWNAAGGYYVAGACFGAMAFMAHGYDEGSLYEGRAVVADAIAFLVSQQQPEGCFGDNQNYETSLSVMALKMTGNPDYDDEIAAATAWLDTNQWDESPPSQVEGPDDLNLGGFGYGWDNSCDLSNSQFSLVALHAAGAITTDIAEDAITFIQNCQGIERDPATQVELTDDRWGACAMGFKWDPTGTRLAYNASVEAEEGPCKLYVQDMDVIDSVVADIGPGEVSCARYSPAADKIAFAVTPQGVDHSDIYTVNADGTGLTQLTGLPEPYWGGWILDWSPDGTKLAMTLCLSETEWDADLHVYDLATNTLGAGLGVGPCAQGLNWSPATSGAYANKILYTSCVSGPPDVWIVDATTGDKTNLTAGLADGCCSDPAWSPDGTQIAFQASGVGPEGSTTKGICLMNPDGSGFEMLTSVPSGEDWSDGGPVWSPDGGQILFRRHNGMVLMSADGTDLRLVLPGTRKRGVQAWRTDTGGTDWLLYLGDDDAKGQVHWLELSMPVPIAPCGASPEWSPAGDRISFSSFHNVFNASDPNDNWTVWVADPEGLTPPVNISGDGPGDNPTWSPDGTQIAFDGRYDLFGLPPDWPWEPECEMSSVWVVGPDGVPTPYNLMAPHHGIGCGDMPDWGDPPGTAGKIAYHGWSDGEDIWTADPDGTGHANLTSEVPASLSHRSPEWSPDSAKLLYFTEEDGRPEERDLWLMSWDGSGKVYVATTPVYEWAEFLSRCWSPDSSQLAFEMSDGIYVADANSATPDPLPIPGMRSTSISDWPAATPYAGDASFITGSSCLLGEADGLMFTVEGFPGSGYLYSPGGGAGEGYISYGSMTAAAVWGLRLCGLPVADEWVQNGLDWLARNYAYDENPGYGGNLYYYLWSAAKGFLVCDVKALPGAAHMPVEAEDQVAFDPGWYYDFSKFLVGRQDAEGCWQGDAYQTALALYILQKELGIPCAVEASLSPDTVSVAPGSPADFTLTVHNIGTEMDSYDLEVVEAPAGWAVSLAPTADDVASDEERPVPVGVTPPADLALWNDTAYNFELRVTSQTDPSISQATSGQVIILATATAGSRYYFVNDLLDALIAEILASGLGDGTIQSLVSKLEAAKMHKDRALEYFEAGELDKAENRLLTAINVMEAFANEIEALREKKIPGALADDWLTKGNDICYRLEVLRDQTSPPVLPGQILFQRYDGTDWHTVVINPDGTGENVLGVAADHSAWSSDNTKIAYEQGGNIWYANADGSSPVQVTSGSGTDDFPAWSPDDTKIAFSRHDTNGQPQVHVVDLGTLAVQQVTSLDLDQPWFGTIVSWSPTGEWIAYECVLAGESIPQVRLVRPDGTDDHKLVDEGSTAAFSPDGTQVLFSRSRPDGECGAATYVVHTDGSDEHLLAYRMPWGIAGCYSGYSCSPDGQHVAVMETPVVCCGGETELVVAARNGLQAIRLTDNTGIDDVYAIWTKATFADLRDLLARMDMTNGLRNAFLGHLDDAEADLAAGDSAAAIGHLQDFSAAAEAERYARLRLSQVDSLMGYAASLVVKIEATN